MKIKHLDIDIPKEDPFKNCKLERKKYAEALTSIIKNYTDGFVLAINSEWGTGKTTFVKMWEQSLQNRNFKTLYFNAWENDFETEPMIAILGELQRLIGSQENKRFKSLLQKGAVVASNILPALVKSLANKYLEADTISDAIENSMKATTEIIKDEVKEYSTKKKKLSDFKAELEIFVNEEKGEHPLIFIIDELDRCRPDYAVEVLEKVKHFFSVNGIIFILSVDKTQLGNSIKGHYGSESIDANEYLRRFIDIEYRLPEPSTLNICNYLYDYFQFQDFFAAPERFGIHDLKNDGRNFIDFADIMFKSVKSSIRQKEKVFAHARICLQSFKSNNYVFPTLFFLLIFLREFDFKFYYKIKNRHLSIQALADKFERKFCSNLNYDNVRTFTSIEAHLLLFYCNYYREIDYKSNLTKYDEITKKDKLVISTTIGEIEEENLLRIINSFSYENYSGTSLDYLLKKIDLFENIAV